MFTIIFKLKNDNFKTRDFSPLIERVLAGVAKVSGSGQSSNSGPALAIPKQPKAS